MKEGGEVILIESYKGRFIK